MCNKKYDNWQNHQFQRHSRRLGPEYLTETPYHALNNDDDEARQPPRSGKSVDLNMHLDLEQLIDKPTLPVLDTRRANFLLGIYLRVFDRFKLLFIGHCLINNLKVIKVLLLLL